MDLTQARDASFAAELDLDLDDEEAIAERSLAGQGRQASYQPVYTDDFEPGSNSRPV